MTDKKCPFMSHQVLTNANGVQFISPTTVDCFKHDCGCWSIQNGQCGLIDES